MQNAEIIFNITYLLVLYFLIYKMIQKLKNQLKPDRIAVLFKNAFLLLAIGDTGHVGFRVWAYAMGGLDSTISFLSFQIPLTGAGALATAFTVTVFYMIFIEIWRIKFQKNRNFIYYLLMLISVFRLIIMCFPQNEWGRSVPVYEWSLIRNFPLTIVGLSLVVLFYIDANYKNDKTFKLISLMILLSFAFYIPVILFVQKIPMIGMLMIPKTLTYLAVAFIGNKYLIRTNEL